MMKIETILGVLYAFRAKGFECFKGYKPDITALCTTLKITCNILLNCMDRQHLNFVYFPLNVKFLTVVISG